MTNNTGYGGWKFVELNESEKQISESVSFAAKAMAAQAGYDASVARNLSITFKKATLTIDDAERRSGAWHSLADGQPFYRMEIAAGNKTIFDAGTDQTAALVFYLLQALGNGGMSMGGPMVLEHDFRGDMLQMGLKVVGFVEQLKPYVVKDPRKGPQPN